MSRPPRGQGWTLALLFIFSFAWSLVHAAPTVYFGDCGEMLAALRAGGVPHPTGFPTYLALATLLSPLGTFAVNAFSGFCAAASIVLIYLLARKSLAQNEMEPTHADFHALAAAFILLGSSTLILNGAVARVYTLQLALWAGVCLLAIGFRPTSSWALAWGFLFGLSSGSHLLFLTALPFTLACAWGRVTNPTARVLPFLGTGLLLGASTQLWIPLRSALNPAINWGEPSNLTRGLKYLLQFSYREKMFARDLPGIELFLSELGRAMAFEWTPLFWALAAIGFAWLARKNTRTATALFLTAFLNLVLLFLYGGEYDLAMLPRYFLPFYAVSALAAGFGWAWWWENKSPASWRSRRTQGLALAILAAASLSFPAFRWRDLSRSSTCWNYVLSLFQSVPRNGILEVAGDFQVFPAAYARHVKGLRPDLRIVNFNETVFPEAGRRLRAKPGWTREGLEMEYAREGGDVLYIPNHRWASPPWNCREWGMTYRLALDPPGRTAPEPPSMTPMRERFTASEVSDGEAQETVSVCLYQRAAWDASRGHLEKALARLGEIERLCGRSANALVNAATLYQRLGAQDKVEPLLMKALQKRPRHYTANLNLGILYGSRKDYLGARRRFQIASQTAPNDRMAREYLKRVDSMLSVGDRNTIPGGKP